MQTLILSDELGRPIQIQVIRSGSMAERPEEMQVQTSSNEQLQFELSAESLNVIQAFELLQGGNVDDTLAALM